MTANPINTALTVAKNADQSKRDFTEKKDLLQNGAGSIGKKLNATMGGAAGGKTNVAGGKAKNEMGKDAFLNMLMAQMKNQNPLSPMDTKEMTANMAQFSALEQLVNMNKKMEVIAQPKQDGIAQGANLIGMKVKAQTNSIQLKPGKTSDIKFNLGKDASEMKVQITDAEGKELRSISRINQKNGQVSVKWDGLDQAGQPLPEGEYSFFVEAKTKNEEKIPVDTKIEGTVKGVDMTKSGPMLLVNDQKLKLSEITSLEKIESEPTPVASKDPVSPKASPSPVDVSAPQKMEIPKNNETGVLDLLDRKNDTPTEDFIAQRYKFPFGT